MLSISPLSYGYPFLYPGFQSDWFPSYSQRSGQSTNENLFTEWRDSETRIYSIYVHYYVMDCLGITLNSLLYKDIISLCQRYFECKSYRTVTSSGVSRYTSHPRETRNINKFLGLQEIEQDERRSRNPGEISWWILFPLFLTRVFFPCSVFKSNSVRTSNTCSQHGAEGSESVDRCRLGPFPTLNITSENGTFFSSCVYNDTWSIDSVNGVTDRTVFIRRGK